MSTKFKQFVSPHVHPGSLDTASSPASFIKRTKEIGGTHLACTDHGFLGTCRIVYDLSKKNDVIPILGLEAYLRDDNCSILKSFDIKKNAHGTYSDYLKYTHLTMHFQDQEAYQTGVKLISLADERAERHGSERKPLFTWNDLEELGSKNVTFGSSCLIGGVIRHLHEHNRPDIAIKHYERLRSIVKPGNFIVEVFPNDCSKNFVSGTFITLENGQKLKFYDKKLLKTNLGEITAVDLVKEFKRKDNKHEALLSIRDYRTWNDVGPFKIINVEKIEDFLPNECTPTCPDGDVQASANRFIIELAKKYGDKVVVSDDSHYAYPDDSIIQDIKLQANGQSSWRFYGKYNLKSSEEAYNHFTKSLGTSERDFEEWVDNSREWASKFDNFTWKTEPLLPKSFYPSDTMNHVFELINKHGRMDWDDKAKCDRLKKEIDLFHNNGTIDLLPYFFLAEETSDVYTKSGHLTGPGRGSSAGVLLSYLLNVTHVDPLKYDLSLERFLTLDRIQSGKMPDIDLDYVNRDILTKDDGFLNTRFKDHWAQISTDIKLKLRSSVKDVHRALYKEVSYDVEELTKRFETPPQGITDIDFIMGYKSENGQEQGSIERDEALKTYIRKYPKEWESVKKCLADISRTKSRHPSAYIITDKPINEVIPTFSINDVKCTQYTAESNESVGGIKMDYLVVNSLNDVEQCIKLIQTRSTLQTPESITIDKKKVPKARIVPFKGEIYDIYSLPEDQNVFDMIANGDTETVFQFNTSGARKWLKSFNVKKKDGNKILDSIHAMAAFTALDRPGPLDIEIVTLEGGKVNALQEYARRATGMPPSESLKILDELFPETNSILIYQENLQKLYQYLTGCTGAEAEAFRREVSKKQKEKIINLYPDYLEKASKKVGKEIAEKAWQLIITWSGYGFCIDGEQEIMTENGYVNMKNIIDNPYKYKIAYLDDFGNLKYEYPINYWDNNKKEVFEVTLEDGTNIMATEDHRFLYDNQWIKLKDLILKEDIGVYIQDEKEKDKL